MTTSWPLRTSRDQLRKLALAVGERLVEREGAEAKGIEPGRRSYTRVYYTEYVSALWPRRDRDPCYIRTRITPRAYTRVPPRTPSPRGRLGSPMMATTIAVLSQKGGTGKTTLTRTLTDVFDRLGLDVLAIDADPQGNLSDYFDTDPDAHPTLADVLQGAGAGRRGGPRAGDPGEHAARRGRADARRQDRPRGDAAQRAARPEARARPDPDRLPADARAADRSTRWSPPTTRC